jgi:hypothetical protein
MREPDLPIVACHDHPIWVALSQYRIGSPDGTATFQDRLARENGWGLNKAARVVEEYRRFCFLAATAGHEVTPSDAVDQAWHLHLIHSRDYWERFCPDVLGQPLHHAPSAGGSGSRQRFFEAYAQTLKSYERVFGQPAPDDLWPGAAQRFGRDLEARRVHLRDYFLIPRRPAGLAWLLGGVASILALIIR